MQELIFMLSFPSRQESRGEAGHPEPARPAQGHRQRQGLLL